VATDCWLSSGIALPLLQQRHSGIPINSVEVKNISQTDGWIFPGKPLWLLLLHQQRVLLG